MVDGSLASGTSGYAVGTFASRGRWLPPSMETKSAEGLYLAFVKPNSLLWRADVEEKCAETIRVPIIPDAPDLLVDHLRSSVLDLDFLLLSRGLMAGKLPVDIANSTCFKGTHLPCEMRVSPSRIS